MLGEFVFQEGEMFLQANDPSFTELQQPKLRPGQQIGSSARSVLSNTYNTERMTEAGTLCGFSDRQTFPDLNVRHEGGNHRRRT